MEHHFAIGQAFWGKIRFPDGEFPAYERPYLIVGVGQGYVEILTVSSVVGKEWKLTLPSNMEINKYNPPFRKRTFVKLDSLQKVNVSDLANVSIAMNGMTLDAAELRNIITSIIT